MRILEGGAQLHVLQFPEGNDLNVFVWNDESEVTVVDSGMPGSAAVMSSVAQPSRPGGLSTVRAPDRGVVRTSAPVLGPEETRWAVRSELSGVFARR